MKYYNIEYALTLKIKYICNKEKKEKKKVVLQTPKTCVKSKSYIKHIKTHLNKKNLFDISFKKSDIIINNKDKVINDDTIKTYISNKKHVEISKVIASFIMKYHNIIHT